MENNYQNNQYNDNNMNFYNNNPPQFHFNNFNKNQFPQNPQNSLYTKIYLGQLPLQITENDLREAFQQHCQLNQIKIVKGNAQGQFARYCYAFLNIKGNQSFSNDVIRKVQQKYSNWRINIRADYEKMQNKLRPQFQNNNPQQRYQPQPIENFPNPNTNFIHPLNFNNRTLGSYNEGEKGVKLNKILVRQIWLGGIPQGITEQSMRQIMGYFGLIQSLQIFSKFAFIKYKLVNDATTAFEKASRVHQQFGRPSGFRIFFSDPQKRTNIVSNHYEYDRQSQYLPILFLGFPPITSSFVDEVYMRSICQKYGPIIDTYMRKSNNPQTRSYILLTYDSIKNAIKAKQQLSKRRDLLGDKRVQVALLLEQQPILKGRNLETTIQKFQASNTFEKRPPKTSNPNTNMNFGSNNFQQQMPNMYMPFPGYTSFNPNNRMNPMPMGMGNQMGMNPPPMMPYFPMMVDNNAMRPGNYYYPQSQPQNYSAQSDDVVKIIESVLNNTKKQIVKQKVSENKYKEEKQVRTEGPSWSGFLIRNKNYRVGADGYAKTQNFNFDESMVNISSLIKLRDIKFKTKKHIMLLEPSNDTQKKVFEEYINYFKKKQSAGVSLFYKQILFVLPKCEEADEIWPTNQHQLLAIMQDVSLYHQIKEKLQKVDQN